MQKLGISLALLALTGCTTTGATIEAPTPPSLVVYHAKSTPAPSDNTPLTAADIRDINEQIAASRRVDWAPQEEVLQQALDSEI